MIQVSEEESNTYIENNRLSNVCLALVLHDAAVLLGAPDAVAVVEDVVRVPAVFDSQQVGVARAEIPEKVGNI